MIFSPTIEYAPITTINNLLMHLASPFTGKVLPLHVHPESIFSQGMLGRGICVEMSSNKVTSPVTGQLEQVRHKGCEFIILANNGLKLLVNIQLPQEYMALERHPINAFGKKDIEQGEVLAYFDIPNDTPKVLGSLVILNADRLGPCYHPLKQVNAGQDPLITITKQSIF